MKQEVSNLKYAQCYYDEDKKLIEQVFTNETEDMTTEDFKATMLEYVGLYEKYDINFVLVDSREMRYIVAPDVQEWVNTNIFPSLMPFVKKIAFLVSSDIFEQVAIQQAIDDQKGDMPIQANYFDNEEEARQWLAE